MRSRERVIWDFVQGWLKKAESDMAAAQHLLEMDMEDFFVAAFHAQQAAEKFLKAFLVRHQIPFPKTHNINKLLELAAQADSSLKAEPSSAAMLTPFGVEFRYPGEESIDIESAEWAVEEALKVRKAVLKRLKEYLDQGPP